MKEAFTLQNDIEELQTLHKMISDLQGKWQLPEKVAVHLNLILDELVTNIIEHGEEDIANNIEISISKKCKELTIQICDSGPEFNPKSCKLPDTSLPLIERKCGGLGILLVKQLSDHWSYTRKNKKNYFTIKKTIPEECR